MRMKRIGVHGRNTATQMGVGDMKRAPVLLMAILEQVENTPYHFSNTPVRTAVEGYSDDGTRLPRFVAK